MDIIKQQLNHRTVRKFKDIELDEKMIETLLNVANHAPTSMGMQQYSVIRVKDPEKRAMLGEIAGQDYINDCPELFVFIVDIYRNMSIAKEKGYEGESYRDMNRFFQGFTDGLLAAQNMEIAIESLGMGSVYFGSILNDIGKVCEILKLPELTFPIVGMGFGYPAEEPQLKPRMDMKFKFFEDEYKIFNNYLDEIEEYDEEMTYYYDTRANGRRSDCFSNQILKIFSNRNETAANVGKIIRKQGFLID